MQLLLIFCVIPSILAATINGRIIGGEDAVPQQFPWHVSINGLHGYRNIMCGGALISNRWVLSTGSCTDGGTHFSLGLGSKFLTAPLLTLVSLIAMVHPDYDAETLANNVGLILTPNNVILGLNIQIISLPGLELVDESFADSRTQISGFGRTVDDPDSPVSMILQWVYQRVIDNEECSAELGDDFVTESTMCTVGYTDVTESLCYGDLGGPLIWRGEDNIPILVGIASIINLEECSSGTPTLFVRVNSHLSWIDEIIHSK